MQTGVTVTEKKRRFIAGAICPRCGELDRLVVFTRDGRDYRACVSCDFEEAMMFAPSARELKTRVNQDERSEAETKPVKFIDIKK